MNQGKAMRPWARWAVALGGTAFVGSVAGVLLERGVAGFGYARLEAAAAASPLALPGRAPAAPAMGPAPGTIEAALADLPTFPDAAPRPLVGGMQAQGAPMAVSYFTTSAEPAAVVKFYESAIAKAGRLPVTKLTGESSGYVGYFDEASGRMRTVSVARQGKQTLVFHSAADGEAMLTGKAAMPESLPQPPGALESLVLRFDEPGAVQHTVFTAVPEKSAAEVRDFYLSALASKGWKVSAAAGEGGALRLEATRSREAATAVLRPRPAPERGTAVYITLISGV